MIKITNLGHASFLIENKNTSIVFDPYQNNSVPNLTFKKGITCNHLFISHEHFDHNAENLVSVVEGKSIITSNFLVPHDMNNGSERGMSRVRIVELDDIKIAHLGDIGDIRNEEVIKKLQNIDIMLCPINGFFTIGAKEAIKLIIKCQPRLFIPMHYYNKDLNTGYPDGNQIDLFKNQIDKYKEVQGCSIEINKDSFDEKVIIFKEALQ